MVFSRVLASSQRRLFLTELKKGLEQCPQENGRRKKRQLWKTFSDVVRFSDISGSADQLRDRRKQNLKLDLIWNRRSSQRNRSQVDSSLPLGCEVLTLPKKEIFCTKKDSFFFFSTPAACFLLHVVSVILISSCFSLLTSLRTPQLR